MFLCLFVLFCFFRFPPVLPIALGLEQTHQIPPSAYSAKISLEILSQKDHTLGVGNREAALGELG